MIAIQEKKCDVCGERVVGKFYNIIAKQEDGRAKVYNGHRECIDRLYKEKTRDNKPKRSRTKRSLNDSSRSKVVYKLVEDHDKVCRPPSPNAPKRSPNYPPKPLIDRRVLDDWYKNEIGQFCRILSKHIPEDKYPDRNKTQ